VGRLGKTSSSSGATFGRSLIPPHLATALATLFLAAWLAVLAAPAASLAAGQPQILSAWVTDVTATGANLGVEINPNGLPTTYRFEYISDAAYRANLEAVPPREGFFGAGKVPPGGEAGLGSGTAPLRTVQHVSGLAPATSYRYRPVATNSAGTSFGPEHVLATQEFSVRFKLPDGRGWELVSPVDKGGGAIGAPETIFGGGDFQAAEAGAAVAYGSVTAFGGAAGAPPSSQYVSTRTDAGWSTQNVTTPLASAAYGDQPDGAPYRVFSTDLARSLLFGGLPCRGDDEACQSPNPVLPGTGAPAGYMAFYLRNGSSGTFASLLTQAALDHSAVGPESFEVSFAGASPDLSHIVLSSCAALTAGATEILDGPGKCDPEEQNLYEWSGAGLVLLNSTPGAAIGASIGAVSANGARVYWTQDGNLHLRDGAQSVAVDEAEGGTFEAASADGAFAFFTKTAELYRYDAVAKDSTKLTPAGGVVGVLGASPDGRDVYFQDASGIEHWHEGGGTSQVAAGAEAAAPSDYPPATATARVSAGGDHLAFLSAEELTGYDNDGQLEVYLYGPPLAGGPPILACASCNPTGERAQGPSTIPGAQANGTTRAYRPRALTADGARLFFDSGDDLALQDTDSRPDVYEWQARGAGGCARSPGCISLISSGRSPDGAALVDASADGGDVYFITGESLVGGDPGSIDLYDARVGGGFPEVQRPIICVGDSCQALPSSPEDPNPGTTVNSSGNPPKRLFREGKRRSHRKRRRGKKQHNGHGKFHVTLKRGKHAGEWRP
jgi:hypothetical protein